MRAAFEARHPVPARLHVSRLAIALAVGLLIAAVALSPAGAKVADLVHDVVQPGAQNARPALTSLPAPGRLLVTSPKGPWVVDQDGVEAAAGRLRRRRLVAPWPVRGRRLAAASSPRSSPTGTVHWSLAAAHPVSDPALVALRYPRRLPERLLTSSGRWGRDRTITSSPGMSLAVRTGLAAARGGAAAQASRSITGPGTNVLAYVDRRGQVTGPRRRYRQAPLPLSARPTAHRASPGRRTGQRFLSASRHAFRRPSTPAPPIGSRPASGPRTSGRSSAASFRPDSSYRGRRRGNPRAARAAARQSVVLFGRTDVENFLAREAVRGTGSPPGPDVVAGRALAAGRLARRRPVALPAAEPTAGCAPSAHISRQFDPGATGRPPSPGISGWCCAR